MFFALFKVLENNWNYKFVFKHKKKPARFSHIEIISPYLWSCLFDFFLSTLINKSNASQWCFLHFHRQPLKIYLNSFFITNKSLRWYNVWSQLFDFIGSIFAIFRMIEFACRLSVFGWMIYLILNWFLYSLKCNEILSQHGWFNHLARQCVLWISVQTFRSIVLKNQFNPKICWSSSDCSNEFKKSGEIFLFRQVFHCSLHNFQ